MNYKFIGAFNLMLGMFQLISLALYMTMTFPEVVRYNPEVTPTSFVNIYLYPLLALALGLVNIFFSLVNFDVFLRSKKTGLFILSFFYLIIYFVLITLATEYLKAEAIAYSLNL